MGMDREILQSKLFVTHVKHRNCQRLKSMKQMKYLRYTNDRTDYSYHLSSLTYNIVGQNEALFCIHTSNTISFIDM